MGTARAGRGFVTADPRHGFHAMVSAIALEGWAGFSRQHGVTRTAAVEAFGRLLAEDLEGLDPTPPDFFSRMISLAREVDSQRRSRGRFD